MLDRPNVSCAAAHRYAPCLGSAAIVAAVALIPLGSAAAQESSLVYPGQTGRLLYATQPDGDRIMDFSRVGYMYGEAPIPFVAQAAAVSPGTGDDRSRIQNAIDSVSSMPMDGNGFRGAVVLAAGEYQISGQLEITASGVVLRGAGDGSNPSQSTILRATGTQQRSLIVVNNSTNSGQGSTSLRRPDVIVDKVVPVGATSFRVASPSLFDAGDRVLITRPGTDPWISDLGMDQIPPRPDGNPITQWEGEDYDLTFERFVTRIEGDRMFLDAPLPHSIDQQYADGEVDLFSFDNRVMRVGIESVRGVSDYDLSDPEDEDHAWTFIEFKRAEHCWARDITAQHFGFSTVLVNERSHAVTVEDAHSIDPISIITGGRRYPFNISRSEYVLMRDMTSDEGRHDFILNSRSEGPNVFYNGLATNSNSDTGPHQRYSTGGLFDNIEIQGDRINFRNRGYFGSGHGIAGTNMVGWNCVADGFIVENPPLTQNWMIGSIGAIVEDDRFGPQELGTYDSHGTPVATTSLYLSQLSDRLARPGGEFREYLFGDYDNYVNDGANSVDAVTMSQSFLDEFGGYLSTRSTKGLDDPAVDHFVPLNWQFQIHPDEQVFHAVLTIAMRKTTGRTRNDSLWIEEFNNRMFFDVDLGLTEELDDVESTVYVYEMVGADLAWFDDGELNVLIGEDVDLDWARLDIYVGNRVVGDLNSDGVFDNCDISTFIVLAAASSPLAEQTGDDPVSIDSFDYGTYFEFVAAEGPIGSGVCQ
ncbi:MAG: hypothetical protein AAGI30_03555 [Planctomycetota bacterium]